MKRLALLALLLSCCNDTRRNGPPPKTVSDFVDVPLHATREARKSFVPAAPALVSFPRARFLHFEPAGARDPIEVAFLDADGKVLDVQTLDPGNESGITSKAEARHALFVPLRTGLAAGDTVVLGEKARTTPAEELVELKIGSKTVYAELAITADERAHGLMFRARMTKDDGMLFVYPEPDDRRFWMGNTWIDLDIAFFRQDGTLINVVEMRKYPDPTKDPGDRARSEQPAIYVLEVNYGWFRSCGLIDREGRPMPGAKLVIPPGVIK